MEDLCHITCRRPNLEQMDTYFNPIKRLVAQNTIFSEIQKITAQELLDMNLAGKKMREDAIVPFSETVPLPSCVQGNATTIQARRIRRGSLRKGV
jgi:hypothetical protein